MINENIVFNYFFEKAHENHNNQNCLLENLLLENFGFTP